MEDMFMCVTIFFVTIVFNAYVIKCYFCNIIRHVSLSEFI